jgi:hypothetical protein
MNNNEDKITKPTAEFHSGNVGESLERYYKNYTGFPSLVFIGFCALFTALAFGKAIRAAPC